MHTITHHETRVRRIIVQRPTSVMAPTGVQAMARSVLALKPGINRVSDEDVKLHAKKLEELEEKGTVTLGDVARAKVREARAAVRNTADVATLEDLAKGTGSVAKEATAQLERIRKPAKKSA